MTLMLCLSFAHGKGVCSLSGLGGLPCRLGVLVLAGPVPWLATLAAIAASTRSLSESKKRLAKFVASALAVVSGILLVLCAVALIALQGAE